jgi:hypothetical protein
MNKRIIATALTIAFCGMPTLALADGIVKLSPLNNTPGYYGNSGYGTTNFGAPSTTSGSNSLPALRDESIPLRGRVSTIPKGTTMLVKLDQPVSSFSSSMGDAVSATLENDIYVNDSIVVPAGSEVLGQVTNVSRSGRVGKHGELDVRFFSVKTPDGVVVPIRAHVVTKDESGILRGNSYTTDVFKGVGLTVGGAGLGAGLGAASGSLIGSVGAGAIFGVAMGGIAGATYALMRQGKDVIIPSGSRISIIADQPTTTTP